jgi:hypothetical protein
MIINVYIEFNKVIAIVSEWQHLQGCIPAHLKANNILMSGKIKVLQSALQKLRNYAILVLTVEH